MTTSKKTMAKNFAFTAILISSLMFTNAAFAQLEQQTVIADPGRAGDRLIESTLIPQSAPNISIKKMELQNAPAGAENIKFNFGGIKFNGVSIYNQEELASIYRDKIGTEISLADLYTIANNIALKYRNDGYILSRVVVPPQTIESGLPNLLVVEGFVDNITINGGEENASALRTVEDYAGQISKGGPLNIESLERYLLLINDLPGIEARTVISPSPSATGAADLLIILERDPFEALVSVDNFGSRFLGPLQFSGATIFNSAFGHNEQITAQAVIAPDAGIELAFGSLGYQQPVGPFGTTVSAGVSITDTDPGFTLDTFDVEGLSRSLFVGAEHPVLRSRNTNIFARLLLDFRNVESKNNVEATRKDKIRAIRAGVKADFLDRLLGVAVNSIDFQVSQGVDILGSSDEGDANLTRPAGDPTFTKANLRVERLQRVTKSVNVVLSGRAQISSDPLLSSEEFGLGGISSVRGYDPSETVGDDGIGGTVEVQWNTPSRKTQVFGFLDSGTVWNQDATTSNAKRNSLTSTGVGVRVDLPMDVNAEVVAAQPLNRDIQTRGNREPQFFFSLNKKF